MDARSMSMIVALATGIGGLNVSQALQIGPKIRVNLGNGSGAQFLNNAAAERGRVEEHAGNELTNLGKNVVEAADVAGKTVNRQWLTVADTTGAALQEVGRGDVLGAGYVWQRDFLNGTRSNAVEALEESSGLRFVAQVAVSAYFGPIGTGLFTGAYTYEATGGNVNDALRAGAVSGLASAASAQISQMPTDSSAEIAGRALLAGHVSGTAYAIMGGRYEDGFESGALFSVADAIYQNETQHSPNGEIGGAAYCKTSLNADCSVPFYAVVGKNDDGTPMIDIRATNPLRDHIGLAQPGSSIFNEGSGLMRTVNLVPGMNTMAFFHDIWAADFSGPTLPLSIVPATMLTYYALGAPRDRDLLNQAIDSNSVRDPN